MSPFTINKRSINPFTTVTQSPAMNQQQINNPLHGITLEQIVKSLVEQYGFDELSRRIDILCFSKNPSVKSSLTFLRKTPWARKRVEELYLRSRG